MNTSTYVLTYFITFSPSLELHLLAAPVTALIISIRIRNPISRVHSSLEILLFQLSAMVEIKLRYYPYERGKNEIRFAVIVEYVCTVQYTYSASEVVPMKKPG